MGVEWKKHMQQHVFRNKVKEKRYLTEREVGFVRYLFGLHAQKMMQVVIHFFCVQRLPEICPGKV